MDTWRIATWGLALVAATAALYGLHRLCLWLEARGQLYYLHKKPEGGAAGALVELQKALDPTTRHVLHIKEEKRRPAEEEAPGRDGSPRRPAQRGG